MRSRVNGEAMREYRERRDPGLSQTEVAKRIGISQQALSSYEGSRSVPGWDHIELMCSYWGIDIPEFKRLFIVRRPYGNESKPEVA